MFPSKRLLFQQSLKNLAGPRAPFPTQAGQNASFDRNMPIQRRAKAWERDNESKDSWFRRKHAHHHAAEKKKEQEKLAQRGGNHEIDNRRKPRQNLRTTLSKLKTQPMVDYVYGMNSVLAALKAGKRQDLNRLYVYNPKDTSKHAAILKLAEKADIRVIEDYDKHDLNKLTDNAVHNGYVLETKPLEVDEIKALTSFDGATGTYNFEKSFINKTIEESAKVVRFNAQDLANPEIKKFPLGLYLDEITDPHNMGAIIRSAYFLGVDFVVVSERNCARLSPAVSKVSSGAMEFIPIYTIDRPLNFFEVSTANGWSIVSALSLDTMRKHKEKSIKTKELSNLLQSGPTLLAIGSEGEGIRKSLVDRSTHAVAYNSDRMDIDNSVDSLNASVATALLISKFLV